LTLQKSRDHGLREILVIEELGWVLLATDSRERPNELGSLNLYGLEDGRPGPQVYATGADAYFFDEARGELYVRNPLFGRVTVFNLHGGASRSLGYQSSRETLVFTGSALLRIAQDGLSRDRFTLERVSDGRLLGRISPQSSPLNQRVDYVLKDERFLWVLRGSKRHFEELIDLSTGEALFSGPDRKVSGLSETAPFIGVLETRSSLLSRFDHLSGLLSPLGRPDLSGMDFVTGFHLFGETKARIATYQREVKDLDFAQGTTESTDALSCGGTVQLSPNGHFALCDWHEQAAWWRIEP
jgi:hypothetical protein